MGLARIIKRYVNRKFYDTKVSKYVTLDDIAAMIRAGDEVRVVDNDSKLDLTGPTMAHILFAEERLDPHLSVEGLRRIIVDGL